MSSLPSPTSSRTGRDDLPAQGPPSTLDPTDSGDDSKLLELWLPSGLRSSRWLGWRLRLLVVMALLGCTGVFLLTRGLAEQPRIDASWHADAQGQLELVASQDPALTPFLRRALLGVIGGDAQVAVIDGLALQRSPRWLVHDAERARHRELHTQLAAALAQPRVRLYFTDGGVADLAPTARGVLGLGVIYALLMALAFALYLVAMVVLLVRPSLRNALYAVMALAQTGNLLFVAAGSALDLALPPLLTHWETPIRTGLDLVTAAAILHAFCVHPRRLPWARSMALTGWLVVATLLALIWCDALTSVWWWTQGTSIAFGLTAIALLSWSFALQRHPQALLLRRFGVVTAATLILLTAAIAASDRQAGTQQSIAAIGSTIWVVFMSSLLLLVPFLSRSQQLLREFSLLAGISTVATSLHLLFLAAFSLGPLTSIMLSVLLSLGLYAGARQWVLSHMRPDRMLSMERLFERLYRMAREVEAQPERASASLLSLLRELFEPLDVVQVPRPLSVARASRDGSTLLVPIPDLAHSGSRAEETLVLRFAQHGHRLFNREDARLADRVVEQLKRAIAFDQAVERGRSEERLRLAQDLHDDIGARLLTMMYQAHSPEHEDYIRHTLQDLKTLTRGLAASRHLLSHAAGEWKVDMLQRLHVAHIVMDWQASFDCDTELNMIQWSALTRVLRELISNTIAHSQATQVSVQLSLLDDELTVTVRDNGHGRDPNAWAPGLGVGGVRKRVKQLGGEVQWLEAAPNGIECRVRFARWSQSAAS